MSRTIAPVMSWRADLGDDGLVGVGVVGTDLDVDGVEAPGVDALELEIDHAPASRGRGVEIDKAETLVVTLLAEVDPLETARVDDVRASSEHLVAVDVSEGDVLEAVESDGASEEHVVGAKHHRLFGAGDRVVDGHVPGENRGDIRGETLGLRSDQGGQRLLNPAGDLFGAEPAHVVPGHELTTTNPRYSDYLDRTRGGLDPVGRGAVSDCDPGLCEGAVDFERGRAALYVRRVVISD